MGKFRSLVSTKFGEILGEDRLFTFGRFRSLVSTKSEEILGEDGSFTS